MEITRLDELNEQFFELMRRADAIGSNNLVNPFFNTDVLWSKSEFSQEGSELYKSLVQRFQEDGRI